MTFLMIYLAGIGAIMLMTLLLTLFDAGGLVLWGIGFYFEAVGDWQLTRFKGKPDNAGAVLDSGLWAWTRHPNYFGDAALWRGIFLFAVSTPSGILTT